MPDISKLEQLCEVLRLSIDELKSKMEHTLEKQENIDLSALTSIAPFLHESDLIEFVERAKVKSIREVVCIAPFLDEETLDKLVVKLVEAGNADKVKGLYPFLSRNTLKRIAEELCGKS